MNIGNTIKTIRKQRKMTQQQLADQMGISRSYLSDIENGNKNPSAKTLEKLAKKLNVSITYLTTGMKTLNDLTEDEINNQLNTVQKVLRESKDNSEREVKNYLLELIQKDLSFIEVKYFAEIIKYYEAEKNDKENLFFISFLLKLMHLNKDLGEKETFDYLTHEFDNFLKQYLNIK
ncbi:XRE family transcriptional regulator [Macrococcoides caseolyticum subsp. caseolyticum]|uniref:helix-turn-helix domain-containing protein n=1 Tax=Macrococcoides caseolyticum TaxID=69966 RepID=UPI000CD082F7|nr:helix-turn-helix transcriptional regulator [Macrococcus caseolyticus]PNZ74850.1 transcriptional regulator [Macrococcus caseolyticus]QPT46093.1 helix-turn-helix transcriptional regulator [Macrococcus caseolyticus]RAK45533.1 XRE family transcriptional regulator [Macrococcus caseolyticus subsp. caseolyticus]HCD18965.1 XRE family transcriptional regulator [Macrococcus caseolyticus]